jgi:undecaprenyl-diphosphatase
MLVKMEPSLKRTLLIALNAAFLILMAISRIYLGDHWLSDVLGAFVLGGIWLCIEILIWIRLGGRPGPSGIEKRR